MSKVYYTESYKLLYDIFNKYVSNPLFPLTHIKESNFLTETNRFTVNRILPIFSKMNAKLRYISSGSTGHFFKGVIIKDENKPICDSNIITKFALKLTPYLKCDKYKSIYEKTRPENTELNMLKCLSYFVLTGQTRHLLLPIQSFYCPIHEFVKIMEMNKVNDNKQKYKKFIDGYHDNRYEDIVTITVSELADEGDLLNYIRTHSKSIKPYYWKIFFFQLLSVLAIIQLRYPSFRHNDLKANNILLQKVKRSSTKYIINNKCYILPEFDLCIKMWDFDFACIPGYVNNIKVEEKWTRDINITTKQNRYYDIHYFFSTLQLFYPKIKDRSYVGDETVDFINDIIPESIKKSSKTNDKGRLLVDEEYITPLQLLENHGYFKDFRK